MEREGLKNRFVINFAMKTFEEEAWKYSLVSGRGKRNAQISAFLSEVGNIKHNADMIFEGHSGFFIEDNVGLIEIYFLP